MCLWNTTPVDTKSDWIFLLAVIQATTLVGFFLYAENGAAIAEQ